ncbi:MAG: helix-turn-helix domain-containing protein [bacterium]|nr:helix-turn-helix domain-containing protein [bacterium]
MKYRLYPTEEPCEIFARTFGCCCKIWNLMRQPCIRRNIPIGKKWIPLHLLGIRGHK